VSTPTLAVGTHRINVLYSGDSNYAPNKSPVLIQTVLSGARPPFEAAIP